MAKHVPPVECKGQLSLVCESCDGSRFVRSDDTPTEVCADCAGTGIDADAAYEVVVVRTAYMRLRELPPSTTEPYPL